MNKRLALSLAAAVALLGTGCRKQEVASYRVPKEAVPTLPGAAADNQMAGSPAAGGAGIAGTAVATASGNALAWSAPAHWTVKTASAMRKGSYTIKGDGAEADVSITAFPGDVGGDLANLNRWRGQLQLAPVGQAEFEAATQHLDSNSLHMTVADIVGSGSPAQRILGAMVPFEGATWFVKVTGPDALLTKEKPAFLAFLATVKPAASAP